MLRVKLLRTLLLLSLALAVLFPCYEYFVDHPHYHKLLIDQTEDEAIRHARYMVHVLGLENSYLLRGSLPDENDAPLKPFQGDKRLLKFRIFSATGEIIHSTLVEEEGRVNDRDYFRQIVAKGNVFSKVVQKDNKTADGDVFKIDVVETYVPFMIGHSFGGAFELYYDITESVRQINVQLRRSMAMSITMSAVFFLAIFGALSRANVSLLKRAEAEKALREANEALEARVEARTEELSSANEQLSGQIAEKTLAQVALAQALDDLKADREKLEVILSSVPDGVLVIDGEFKVRHVNIAAEKILNASLMQLSGQKLADVCTSVDLAAEVLRCLEDDFVSPVFDFDLKVEGFDHPRTYQARVAQFSPEEGPSPGIILLISDVTREREIDRMKNAFLGMAAHELNTPLTAIIGYAELLTTPETVSCFEEGQKHEFLELIHNKALALGRLIDDLLDISRIESGRPLPLDYKDFCLVDMARQLIDAHRTEGLSHTLEFVCAEPTLMLCADRTRLEQVLEHLLSNALKFSAKDGTIRVALSRRDDHAELEVVDHGVGMTREQLAHIFDRFYRGDSSDTAAQGAGLGMSLVYHVVLAHHGATSVESQLGEGARVVIQLPLAPSEDTLVTSSPFVS
ncbi:MAG: ATP-binding protein [Desulfuromonadales bacterium]|nr:ATP-binding protein [Desulfuromonadales bacterium]